MTDETRPDDQAPATEGTTEGTSVAEAPLPTKLRQAVELRDIGPCKKHIKVSIEREDVESRLDDHYRKLVKDSYVPGFRPGKAPRKLVERQFQKDVGQQVKGELLLASLEQLGDDYDLAPLSPPNIDPARIDLPREGPLVYEFEVEVRPQFDVPNYKGLKLKRPVIEFGEAEVERALRRVLAPHGQVVPKPEGNAQTGDILVAEVEFRDGDRVLNKAAESRFTIDQQLAFKDGLAPRFAEQVAGASPGDVRTVDVTVSDVSAEANLRGKEIKAVFHVKDVKALRLPELTEEFLETNIGPGIKSAETLRELVRTMMDRQLAHEQRQAFRKQIAAHIAASANWELPEDLLRRQARKAMARRLMEMRADGIPEAEIKRRERLLHQDILRSTEVALKEHFVLQKIAEVEKIEVDDNDLDAEIERLAAQSDDSPRRIRARLERDDLLDALAAEMIERRVLDLILESAEYEDVKVGAKDQPPEVTTAEVQAVPGELADPTAAPPETEGTPAAAPPA